MVEPKILQMLIESSKKYQTHQEQQQHQPQQRGLSSKRPVDLFGNNSKMIDNTDQTSSSIRRDDKCHVCGDKSTGSHFGGISCESCKAFFRRSVQNNRYMDYKCSYINECKMNQNTRKICQSCRYQTCLDIGMRPKWVLSDSERQQKYGARRRVKTLHNIKSTDINNNQTCENSSNNKTHVVNETDDIEMTNESPMDSSTSSSPPDIDDSLLLEDKYYKNAVDAIDASNLNLTAYEKVLIDKLTYAFYYSRKYHAIDMGQLVSKIGEIKKSLITDDKNSKVVLANFMVQPVKRVLTFAKLLPDFRKLNLDDQLALLRGSTLEIVICSSMSLFDSQTNSLNNVISKDRNIKCDDSNVDNLNLKLELLKYIWPSEVLDGTLKYLKTMKSYNIDEITVLLYLPLILFSPDRRDLKNRSRIMQIQSKYSIVLKKFLLYKYKDNLNEAENLFKILLLKLIDLRDLHELHSSILLGADQTQLELYSQAIIKHENEENMLLNKSNASSSNQSSISSNSIIGSPFSNLNSYDIMTPSTTQTDIEYS